MSLNIAANHYQMTYYFAIGMMFFMVVYFAFAAKNGELVNYFKAVRHITWSVEFWQSGRRFRKYIQRLNTRRIPCVGILN